MPLSDFRCRRCQEVREYLHKHQEQPNRCKICDNSEGFERLFPTEFTVKVKGTGSYSNREGSRGSDKRELLSDTHREKLYGQDE